MAKIRITYRHARVMVGLEKTGYCLVCYDKGRTEMHHVKYAYTTKEVRAHHQLALDNTVELCFRCHRIANAIRIVDEAGPLGKTVAQVCGS